MRKITVNYSNYLVVVETMWVLDLTSFPKRLCRICPILVSSSSRKKISINKIVTYINLKSLQSLSLSLINLLNFSSTLKSKGHFTHGPRAVTMKVWEPKRKFLKAVPRHLQNHVVWSRTLKCSAKSYLTGPSTKCYFNEFLVMWVLTHDKIKETNGCERSERHSLLILC
jgi:hypothetical protein